MRTCKHALVLVMPSGQCPRGVDERHVMAMRGAVTEYIATVQRMHAPSSQGVCETTRLLVSVGAVDGSNATDVSMARPVAIGGQARDVSRTIAQELEAQVHEWRQRREETSRRGDGQFHAAVMGLLQGLKQQQFRVSVIAPAGDLPVVGAPGDRQLERVLQQPGRIEFVLLRDDKEDCQETSKRVLELLRVSKTSGQDGCSIRHVEDCEIELQGIVKEWLYEVAPVVHATVRFARTEDREEKRIEFEIRANHTPVVDGLPRSVFDSISTGLKQLQFEYFVSLPSVHPAFLVGCPLHAKPAPSTMTQGLALSRRLRDQQHGAVVSCLTEDGARVFHLLAPGPTVNCSVLLYRIASAEEILFPAQEVGDEGELEPDDSGSGPAWIESLPLQDFNPFRNRSGIHRLAAISDPNDVEASLLAPSRRAQAKSTSNSHGKPHSRKPKRL